MRVTDFWTTVARGQVTRRRLLTSAGITSTGAFLAACGVRSKPKTATTGSSGAAEQPRRGGKFTTVRQGGPPASNNVFSDYGEATFLAGALQYDRPFFTKFQQPYVLGAAESIEQPDPTTLVMKLKAGLKYQNLPPVNGRDVAADDIVAGHLYNKSLANSYQNTLERSGMDSISASDSRTVVLKLKAPRAYLFSASELGAASGNEIVPKELLDKLETNTPVGSGPYQQTPDTTANVTYKYKRFDGFRDAGKGLPYIDEREVRIMADASAIEAAFRSQQLDFYGYPTNTQAKRLQADLGNKIVVYRYLTPQTFTFNTNPKRAPWTDPRVREAMYRIIDRKQILDLVFQGEGVLPPGLVSAALTDYQPSESETAQFWKHDPAEGKKLLEAAGFDFGKEYSTVFPSQLPTTSQSAQVVQQQLAAVGVKSYLTGLETAAWFAKVRDSGDFDMDYSNNPAFDTPQQSMRLHHTQTNFVVQYAGIKDPKFDAMIEKTEQTLDHNQLVQQVKQTQLALLGAYTNLFVVHTLYVYQVYWAHVRNLQPSPLYSFVPDQLNEVWIAPH